MAYVKQNFASGHKLKASEVNHIEDGLVALETSLANAKTQIKEEVMGAISRPTGTINITQNGTYNVTDYANADVDVEGGEMRLQSKSVTPSASNQDVFPDSDYNGLSQVTVAGDTDLVAGNIKKGVSIFNVTGTYEGSTGGSGEVRLQSKSVTPSASNQVVLPDTAYNGLSQVTINGDTDLVASNIKKGVSIFNVTGTYEGSTGGSGGSGGSLVTKSGTTTTATFDTGLSEIVSIILIKDTVNSVGLVNMAVMPQVGKCIYGYCTSYSDVVKMYGTCPSTLVQYGECVINGGTVAWTGAGSYAFVEGETYSWYAVGY